MRLRGFLLLFVVLTGKGSALGTNFLFLSAINVAKHRAMRICWDHTALMNVPYMQAMHGLVESILAVHFRVGLGLVLEQGFEFGLNSGLNKLTKNK